jgi:aspartyl/asparaginyl beta-hydroxylase (cupin superfamily)
MTAYELCRFHKPKDVEVRELTNQAFKIVRQLLELQSQVHVYIQSFRMHFGVFLPNSLCRMIHIRGVS